MNRGAGFIPQDRPPAPGAWKFSAVRNIERFCGLKSALLRGSWPRCAMRLRNHQAHVPTAHRLHQRGVTVKFAVTGLDQGVDVGGPPVWRWLGLRARTTTRVSRWSAIGPA